MAGQSTKWEKGQNSLSSDWSGLSRHLVASFFPVEKKTNPSTKASYWQRVAGAAEVQAPLTEGTIDHTINWTSPFENMGVDQKLGTVSALLQTGGLESILMLFKEWLGGTPAAGAANATAEQIASLEGRSGVTKLNSTQVFTGLPPTKITVTAHFRALADPRGEVHDPVNQLIRWALPQELAPDGVVGQAVKNGNVSLYPSRIPQVLGLSYAGMLLMPLVVEGVPFQMTVPRDRTGAMLNQTLTLTLATLTSIDSADWAAMAGKAS